MLDPLAGLLDLPLVNFKLDPTSNNVVLDQEPLQKVLQKFKDWTKDLTSRGFERLHEEMDMQIANTRSDLTVTIVEKAEELEDRFVPKSVVHELQDTAAAASERSLQVENKQNKLFERVNHAVEKADEVETNLQSIIRQIDSGVLRHLDDHASVDVPADGPDGTEPNRLVRARSRTTGLGGIGGEDLRAHNEAMEVVNERMKEYKEKMELLDDRVDAAVETIKERLDRCESADRAHAREGEAQGQRLDGLEVTVHRLGAEATELAKELRTEKADLEALTALEEEVCKLEAKVDQACMTESLELRMAGVEQRAGGLERRAAQLERISKEAQQGAETIQQSISDADNRIAKCEEQATAVVREAENQFQHRCLLLEAEDRKSAVRIDEAEAQLKSHHMLLLGLSDKASTTEVTALKGALCSLAEDFKEKEQAVLFGARCLSCNRVFDDVQPESGVVNVRAEKQKAQVLADVQRALHTPRTDPTQPIKMLAVKVGRPGQLTSAASGLGPFQGRDPSSLSWAAEDVSLMPVRNNFGGADRGREAALPPASARSASGSAGGQGSEGRRAGSGWRQRDGAAVSAMDFKHPVSHLVGRA